jgi:hypothetical protein
VREIAFRIWDRKAAAWHHFNLHPLQDQLNALAKRDLDEATLTQSTGVTDKNETPLYEGDVLRDRTGATCVIVFEAGCFQLVGKGDVTWPLSSNGSHY